VIGGEEEGFVRFELIETAYFGSTVEDVTITEPDPKSAYVVDPGEILNFFHRPLFCSALAGA
jgi:hypothetical protein